VARARELAEQWAGLRGRAAAVLVGMLDRLNAAAAGAGLPAVPRPRP
jgi:hypothetical protein